MRKRRRLRSLITLVIVAGVIIAGRLIPVPKRGVALPPAEDSGSYFVESVVDGDTVHLTGLGSTRFIGVDTPERDEIGYNEATEFTRRRCGRKWVEAEICPVNPHDKYGRWRAVIHYIDDAGNRRCLNEELVISGHASAFPLQPCHIADRHWISLQMGAAARPVEE